MNPEEGRLDRIAAQERAADKPKVESKPKPKPKPKKEIKE